jgi:hypothetical protein
MRPVSSPSTPPTSFIPEHQLRPCTRIGYWFEPVTGLSLEINPRVPASSLHQVSSSHPYACMNLIHYVTVHVTVHVNFNSLVTVGSPAGRTDYWFEPVTGLSLEKKSSPYGWARFSFKKR